MVVDSTLSKRLFQLKGFFSLPALLFSISLSLLSSAAVAFPNGDSLLGFSQAEYELAINPCVDEGVLLDRFGADSLRYRAQELAQWPSQLCENPDVASKLVTWNYHYTSLLANTERPAVFATEINKYLETLKACSNVNCLNRLLPRMTEWVYLNIDRLPVYTDSEAASRSQAVLAGEPVVHPALALRNLPLTLSGLSEVCKGGAMSDLNFFTVNFSVEGRPLVLAMCKEPANEQGVWLLERLDLSGNSASAFGNAGSDASGWREILVERGDGRLYVLTNSRTTYPTLYSRRSTGAGEEVVVYEFQAAAQRYARNVVLNVEYDALGRSHAFMQ